MAKRVAIAGPAQTGKTTGCNALKQAHGGVVCSFAGNVKKAAEQLGWKGEKTGKGRWLLQNLGRLMREYDEDTWITMLRPDMSYHLFYNRNVFVDDLRFPNEANWLRGLGFTLVRIHPVGFDLSDSFRDDPSEHALDDYMFDAEVRSVKGDVDGYLKNLHALF